MEPTGTLHTRECWEVAYSLEFQAAHVCCIEQHLLVERCAALTYARDENIFHMRLGQLSRARDAMVEAIALTLEVESLFRSLRWLVEDAETITDMRSDIGDALRHRFEEKRGHGERLTREELAIEARLGTELYVVNRQGGMTDYFEMNWAYDGLTTVRERLEGSSLFMYEL